MKKLVTAFALCAAMSAMAQSVESENVVGYQTKTLLTDVPFLFGGNFQAVGGTDSTLADLQNAAGWTSGDLIQFPNVDQVTGLIDFSMYIYKTVVDDWADQDGWYDFLSTEYAGAVALPADLGVWVIVKNDGSVTVKGQVNTAASATLNFLANIPALVANPYPAAFNPNAVACTWSAVSGDLIQVQNVNQATGLIDFSMFIYKTVVDDWADQDGWYDYLSTEYVVAPIAGAGEGFWVIMTADGSLTVDTPIVP